MTSIASNFSRDSHYWWLQRNKLLIRLSLTSSLFLLVVSSMMNKFEINFFPYFTFSGFFRFLIFSFPDLFFSGFFLFRIYFPDLFFRIFFSGFLDNTFFTLFNFHFFLFACYYTDDGFINPEGTLYRLYPVMDILNLVLYNCIPFVLMLIFDSGT